MLQQAQNSIDVKYLMQFPEFVEFRTRPSRDRSSKKEVESTDTQTPEESLETAYERMRGDLEAELLEQVKAATPEFFERLVVQLLVNMGYGGTLRDAGQAVGRSGDGGIDGIIKEDRLGLDAIYI